MAFTFWTDIAKYTFIRIHKEHKDIKHKVIMYIEEFNLKLFYLKEYGNY